MEIELFPFSLDVDADRQEPQTIEKSYQMLLLETSVMNSKLYYESKLAKNLFSRSQYEKRLVKYRHDKCIST